MINNLTGSTYPINPADTWDRLWEQVTIEEEFWVKVKQSTIQSRIDLVVYDIKDADMYFPEAEIQGVLKGGNISVNSGSAVRRTASFELIPSLYKREQEIEEWEEENGYAYYVHLGGDLAKWLTKKIRVILWIRDFWYGTDPNDNDGGTWYPFNMGMFMLSSANSSYDAQNNTLSIELTDMMAMLDGTLNGQVGGVISTVIPAYEEDPETGEPISHNSIAKAIEHVCDMAGLSGWQYIIDEVGEHMAFPMFNLSGWEKYREDHPLWNMIPYDLEFSTGATMWSIIEELVNLYPNFDCAFDKNGVLRVRLIPSSDSTFNCFGFSDYYDLIISEQISTDLSTVRNICEVWGEGMDTDWYTDDVTQGKYVVYVIQVTKPDDGGNFYVDLKYIIQEKTIKTERINCYRNLSTDVEWEELKILYDNGSLKIKALRDGMICDGNTYNTNQIIYYCEYADIGIMPGTPDPNYTYDSTLNFSCLNSYYVSSTTQLLSTHNDAFYKLYEGGAIAVEWGGPVNGVMNYGPVLISTNLNNVLYTDNPESMTPDGVWVNNTKWFVSTLDQWNTMIDSNATIPLLEMNYVPSANTYQTVVDILTASGYTVGQVLSEGTTPYQAVVTRTSDLDVYEVPLEGYPTAYRTGDRIAVDFRNTNIANQMMRINNLDPLPIINQMDKMPVGANFFDTGHTHVFQIVREKGTKDVTVYPYPEEHDLVGRWDGGEQSTSHYRELGLYNVSAWSSADGFSPINVFRTTNIYNLNNHSDYWCAAGVDSYIQIELISQVHVTKIQYYGIIPEGYHNVEFTFEYSSNWQGPYMHATSFSYDNTTQGEFMEIELDKPVDGRCFRLTAKGEGFNLGALHLIGWSWAEPTMDLTARMTSNVSSTGTTSDYGANHNPYQPSHPNEPWEAFYADYGAEVDGKVWNPVITGAYIQYEFKEPVYITSWTYSFVGTYPYQLQYSIDGETYTSLSKCHTGYGDNYNYGFYFADECFTCKYIRIMATPMVFISSVHFYGFKVSDLTIAEEDTFIQKFYYLGVAQAHAIDVITDGTIIENGWWDPGDNEHKGRYYDKYSQEYYERILNCDVVSLTVRKDSPFVVQKLGDRIDVKEGGEFANITSNELALERAQYENWKNARMSDNVTITTKLLPFIEPFMKIDYKKANSKEKRDYIVNSVSHDFDNGTTTIQMATFYPLYKENPGNNSAMTYNYMAGYRNEDLSGDEDEIL